MPHFSQLPPAFGEENTQGDNTAPLAFPARAEDLETLSWFLGHLLNRTDPSWLSIAQRHLADECRPALQRVQDASRLLQTGRWQNRYTLMLARIDARALLDALNAANLTPDYQTLCSIGVADGLSPQDAGVRVSYCFTVLSRYQLTLAHRLYPGQTTNLIACINEMQDRLPPGWHILLARDDIKLSARELIHRVSAVSMAGASVTAPATLKWIADPDRVERLRVLPKGSLYIAQLTLDDLGVLQGGVYRVLMEPELVELTGVEEEIARHN